MEMKFFVSHESLADHRFGFFYLPDRWLLVEIKI
jgi:hypothetical protein